MQLDFSFYTQWTTSVCIKDQGTHMTRLDERTFEKLFFIGGAAQLVPKLIFLSNKPCVFGKQRERQRGEAVKVNDCMQC